MPRVARPRAIAIAELKAKLAALESKGEVETIPPAIAAIYEKIAKIRERFNPVKQGLTDTPQMNYDNRILGHELAIAEIQARKNFALLVKQYHDNGIRKLEAFRKALQDRIEKGMPYDKAMANVEAAFSEFDAHNSDLSKLISEAESNWVHAMEAHKEWKEDKKSGVSAEIEEEEDEELLEIEDEDDDSLEIDESEDNSDPLVLDMNG